MDVVETMDDTNIAIITLGESGVGKTSLIDRFVTGKVKEKYSCTLELETAFRGVKVNDENILLRISDTAGQERFDSLPRSYYRKADGVLLVYDVTSGNSYSQIISRFLPSIEKECKEDVAVLIVGNKIDSPKRINVAVSSIRNRAKIEDLEFMTSSAKENTNVDEVFFRLVKKIALKKGIIGKCAEPKIEKLPGIVSGYRLQSKQKSKSSNLPKYDGKIILPSSKYSNLPPKDAKEANKSSGSWCCVIL